MTHRRDINPTPWMQAFNINHGVEVSGIHRMLFVSMQSSRTGDGTPIHRGDLHAQFKHAWMELKDALMEGEMRPSNVVRMTIYTTVMEEAVAALKELSHVLNVDGCFPAISLIGVQALFHPDLLVGLEATAVA